MDAVLQANVLFVFWQVQLFVKWLLTVFCLTIFQIVFVFMRLELLPCRTPLFYCLNAAVGFKWLCGEGDLERGLYQSHHELTVQSLSIASTFYNFIRFNTLGLVLLSGLLKVRMSFSKKPHHQLRHLGLRLQLVNPACMTDVTYLYHYVCLGATCWYSNVVTCALVNPSGIWKHLSLALRQKHDAHSWIAGTLRVDRFLSWRRFGDNRRARTSSPSRSRTPWTSAVQ